MFQMTSEGQNDETPNFKHNCEHMFFGNDYLFAFTAKHSKLDFV
ncbi:hypothetical protein VCRA2133E348_250040 [Vibrio crassostreae]|nr:hypothetical protein VCRA2133E348_250040 [Vibrio crassostreae]